MSQNQAFAKLIRLLKELFQLDQPDLDFGLYRIMHARADEISQFLDQDLLPQVKDAFSQYRTADKAEIEKELQQAVEQAHGLGVDPESTAKVKELRQKIAEQGVDVTSLELEVYDHLYKFFRRYYHEGDFLAKRVYKPGVYAIPYEGEEVKLHWANKDQYYIKTSEYLRDYAFTLKPGADDPMRVHFRLADVVEGEHGNVKEIEGLNRVFILSGEDFIAEEEGESGRELVIRFEYRPATIDDWSEEARANATAAAKKKPPTQKDLRAEAERRLLAVDDGSLKLWLDELAKHHVKADGEKADYSRLVAHLNRYTARNTFDYFIHKDLGGFLRRELDFYIKNEVMHLDDIESETAPRVEQYLSKIKVIRQIAGKIIDFLAQLENFQKKLWLKKKFVTESSYCIRIGCIPEEFYPEISANEAQRLEWVKLHAIDKIQVDLTTAEYSEPLTEDFLKANPTLMVDTSHFGESFSQRLLEAKGNIDEDVDGIVVHGENFQSLKLVSCQFRGKVKLIYLDPPYNTGQDDFVYKDSYQTSSWLSMMADRFSLARELLSQDGVIVVQISDHEHHRLKLLLDEEFPGQFINHVAVKTRSPSGFKTVNLGLFESSEYLYIYGVSKKNVTTQPVFVPAPYDANYKWIVTNKDCDVKEWSVESIFELVANELGHSNAREARKVLGKSAFNEIISEEAIKRAKNVFRLTAIDDSGASKETVEIKKLSRKKRGEVFKHERPGFDTRYILDGQEITFLNKKIKEVDGTPTLTTLATNIWTDIAWEGIAKEGGVTLKKGKKPERLIERLISMFTEPGDLVLDYFAGSGTTPSVALKKGRRYIAIEMESYFDEQMLPRLKRVYFGDRTGVSSDQIDHSNGCMRYFRIESYEDTLNNLEPRRTEKQTDLLSSQQVKGADGLREQYLLRYWLDVETRGQQSLLNVNAFTDPAAYQIKVKRPGSEETREVNVDLIDTFNWLIGITVETIAAPQTVTAQFKRDDDPDLPEQNPRRLLLDGRIRSAENSPWWFRTVTGTTPDGRKTLVIWRKLTGEMEQDNLVLDEWFKKQGYSSKDREFDLIYVNGDNNLENLRQPDDTWKVRLIEEDFHQLMFEETEA